MTQIYFLFSIFATESITSPFYYGRKEKNKEELIEQYEASVRRKYEKMRKKIHLACVLAGGIVRGSVWIVKNI